MDAHGISQNEVARRAGVSSAHISNIMSGKATPSAGVLKKLHGVLFQPAKEERVVPAEVKVLAWKKGDRHGVVVRGAGGGAGQVEMTTPFGSADACPGVRRWSMRIVQGTTAAAGSR